MKNYKLSFILDTRKYTDTVENLTQGIVEKLRKFDAKIQQINPVRKIQFARVTEKEFQEGIYLSVFCIANSVFPGIIREKVTLNKFIYRLLIEKVRNKKIQRVFKSY